MLVAVSRFYCSVTVHFVLLNFTGRDVASDSAVYVLPHFMFKLVAFPFFPQSSLSRSYSAPTKPSKASPSSPQVSRSKTMTAAVRRSYPSAPRSRSASSVSDESEAERHNEASPRLHTRDAKTGSEESGRRTDQPGTDNKSPSTKFTPRGNKTAMLRAQSSRENLRNASKGKSPPFARPRSAKPPSPSPNPASSPSPTIKRVTRSPLDHRAVNSFDFSSEAVKGLSQRQEDTPLNGSYDSAQDAVDEIFRSAGHSSALPESLQMKREDPVNRTFVLGETKGLLLPFLLLPRLLLPPPPSPPPPSPPPPPFSLASSFSPSSPLLPRLLLLLLPLPPALHPYFPYPCTCPLTLPLPCVSTSLFSRGPILR